MPSVSFEANGLSAIASEINAAADELGRAANTIVAETVEDVERDWRQNATETAGEHGKHYPKAIKGEVMGDGLTGEIAPDPSMRQGEMSFEFGGPFQPPHLDGQRAWDTNAPRFMRRVAALRFLE